MLYVINIKLKVTELPKYFCQVGWALNDVTTLFPGANLRTGQQGIFPIAHVVDVDYNDFDPNGLNDDRKERYLLEYLGSVESSLYKV